MINFKALLALAIIVFIAPAECITVGINSNGVSTTSTQSLSNEAILQSKILANPELIYIEDHGTGNLSKSYDVSNKDGSRARATVMIENATSYDSIIRLAPGNGYVGASKFVEAGLDYLKVYNADMNLMPKVRGP